MLTRMLEAYYEKQVILLIDEYDVPLAKASEKGYYPEKSNYLKDTTLETVLRDECLDRLENALKKLPEQEKRLVRLLYFEDMTVKKTAEIFGCSRKTIQNRREKVLEKIRKMMSETSP